MAGGFIVTMRFLMHAIMMLTIRSFSTIACIKQLEFRPGADLGLLQHVAWSSLLQKLAVSNR